MNKPQKVIYFSSDILFIEFGSKKFTKLLKIKKILPIKNKILYLSFKKLSLLLLKLKIEEINKNNMPNVNAEGKRNKPI